MKILLAKMLSLKHHGDIVKVFICIFNIYIKSIIILAYYADYTASGRALSFIEDEIRNDILP